MRVRAGEFALIACLVVLGDFGLWWVANHYLGDTIYNPSAPPLAVPFMLLFLYPVLMAIFNSRLAVVGCAVAFGGVIANTVGSVAFGPVADYIPIPFVHGHYECNLADLSIWSGSGCLIIATGMYVLARHRRVQPPPFQRRELSFSDWGRRI